jgi:chromosome segregation ATPase
LGGKIPRNIKEKVIRQWTDGLTRENIAKKHDIGAGTVTAIIQEARKQEEYQDIDLLRQVSMRLKQEGLELALPGFATRVKKIMEENGINEDQIEPIIQDFAAYCLKHTISYDTVIQSGREALYLEEKFGIPVERIPESIIQAKKRIDRLEDQTQEILRQKQQAGEELDAMLQERDTIVSKLEKYGKEIPSIKRNKELEAELDEAKKLNEQYETSIIGLTKELNDAKLEAMRFDADGIEINARWKDTASRLTICLDELDKLEKKNRQINQS